MARIEKYLPVNSRLVVVNHTMKKAADRQPVWYTTTKEVIVPEHHAAICPLTGKEVRSYTVDGKFTLYFIETMLWSRVILEPGDVDEQAFNIQYSLFRYDVPSITGYSPCSELYPIAVRITKSDWLVKSGDRPFMLEAKMRAMGAKVFCTKTDISETRDLMLQAVEQLMLKMDEIKKENDESYERAQAQLQNSSNPEHKDYEPDEAKALERFNKRVKLIQDSNEKQAKAVSEGAIAFGISTKAYGHAKMVNIRAAMKTRGEKQAAAYHRGAQALANSNDPTCNTLVADANKSQLPVHVMSDALQEAGDEKTAGELNEVFSLVDGE